jgi:hypothetical protein
MSGEGKITGLPGTTLELSGDIINESDNDAVLTIKKNENELPPIWQTSFCTDVCFSSTVDSSVLRVPAHSAQHLKLYIYTDKNRGQGNITLTFRNKYLTENNITKTIFVSTLTSSDVLSSEKKGIRPLRIFPNPASEKFSFPEATEFERLRILNSIGETIYTDIKRPEYTISSLPEGFYMVELLNGRSSVIGIAKFYKR